MAICPFAIQKPVPSHGGPIGVILGDVEHVTASESDPWPWFDDPADQASSHFFIGNGQGGVPDGQIEQYIDTGLQSWAQMAGNLDYISIETEGQPSDPLTQNQVLSFARVHAWLVTEHSFPNVITDIPGHAGLITHGDGGAAWGNHIGCPGALRSAQRPQIIYLAGLILNPSPTPTPTPGESDMVSEVFIWNGQQHVLQISGGTLYNKWNTGGQWYNQAVASGLIDARPAWTIIAEGTPNEQLVVTAERSSDTHVMYFAQTVNTGTWGEAVLT